MNPLTARLPGFATRLRRALVAATATSMMLAVSKIQAQPAPDQPQPEPPGLEIVGQIGGGAGSSAVAVRGDYAYAGIGPRLVVVGVSDPAAPTWLGSHVLPEMPRDIAVEGEHVYVATGGAGLHILDLTDPLQPSERGSWDTPGLAGGIAVSGGTAYVADESGGVRILDVTDPAQPTELAALDTLDPVNAVALEGDTLVTAEGGGVRVVDVSDPRQPRVLGTAYQGAAWDVALAGSLAYVAAGDAGLRIIDIGDPSQPRELADFQPFNYTYVSAIALADDVACLVQRPPNDIPMFRDLWCLDVRDPSRPTPVDALDLPGRSADLALGGDHVFLADLSFGLRIVEGTAGHARLHELGAVRIEGWPTDVAVEGRTAYVPTLNNSLDVVDVNDPARPRRRLSVPAPDALQDIAVRDGIAFLAASGAGLWRVDFRDPAVPRDLGAVALPAAARGVALDGRIAYVAVDSGGLQLLDIGDPRAPQWLAALDTPGEAQDVAVADGVAYVADGSGGLQVIDVRDPRQPKTLAGVALDEAGRVEVSGQVAYVARRIRRTVSLVDITDPRQPRLLGEVRLEEQAHDIALVESILFIAAGFRGVQVIDVGDPLHPTHLTTVASVAAVGVTVIDRTVVAVDAPRPPDLGGVGQLRVIQAGSSRDVHQHGTLGTPTTWEASSVVLDRGYAFVSVRDGGWRVIDVRDPSQPREVGSDYRGWVGAVAGGIAYVKDVADPNASLGRVRLIDVHDPSRPAVLAEIDIGGIRMRWYNDVLYSFGYDGLDLVDVSDPRRPRILAELQGCYRDLAVHNGILYGWQCDAGMGMIKLDVSDLRNIRSVGFIDWHFGEAVDMLVDGDHLYVAHEHDGMLSIRYLGDPCGTPQLGVATARGGRTRAMAFVHPNAYVASGDNRLRVIDASDPTTPRDRGGLDLPAPALDLAAKGDLIVAAAGPAGLILLRDDAAPAPPAHTIFLPVASLGYTAATEAPPAQVHAWQPAVSPDGRWMVYVADDLTADRTALRLRWLADRSETVLATPELAAVETPTFTPDGQAVVFAARLLGPSGQPANWEIYRVTLDGSGLTNLSQSPATDERRPVLSRDGHSLAFDSDRGGNEDVYIMDLGTGATTRLTDDPALDRLAAFSPDGTTLLFRSERDGRSHIYSARRDGGVIRQLTHGPSYDTYASFSPDGRTVVFQSQRDCPPLDRVYLMNADGGWVRGIGDSTTRYATPRFRPNGPGLVLSAYRDGRWQVVELRNLE